VRQNFILSIFILGLIMLWVHDKFENGSVRFVRSTSPSRSLSMLDMSGSSSLLGRCGLSGLTDLFELSSSSDPYVSSSHPVRLGHRAHLIHLDRRARSTRLCRQVGLICLDRLASPTYHGCRVCQVRLRLSLECEVEWEEFQIPPFFRVFKFLLI